MNHIEIKQWPPFWLGWDKEEKWAESITPMDAFSFMPESSFTPLISREGRTNNTESALETEITGNESQVKQCVLQLTHYMIACENSPLFSLLTGGGEWRGERGLFSQVNYMSTFELTPTSLPVQN